MIVLKLKDKTIFMFRDKDIIYDNEEIDEYEKDMTYGELMNDHSEIYRQFRMELKMLK